MWHFRFHGPTAEALVKDRERVYFEHYWNDFAADASQSIGEEDRRAYAAAYARPGRMRAGWGYFASFPQTAVDFAGFAKRRLLMPVLALGGAEASGVELGAEANLVAASASVVVLENTGHWLLEENPEATTDALLSFL